MTAIAAAAGVPSTNLEWRQWVRRMVEELGLPSAEAHLLQVLGDRANGTGTIRLGVPLLARQLGGISESQVYRRLNALARRGILRTRQQGRGRVALRELIAVPAPAQLSLFDETGAPTIAVYTEPVPAPPSFAAPAMPWPVPASVKACPRTDASLPSHQCEAAVEGQMSTKEGSARRAPDPTADPHPGIPMVLQPRLDDVLGVLDAAPGLVIEPMAVNSALAAHPESAGHDHLRAAFTVASWAFEGGLRHSAANRLLLSALRQQTRPPAAAGGRGHEGRARRAPAVPAVVTGGYMRED